MTIRNRYEITARRKQRQFQIDLSNEFTRDVLAFWRTASDAQMKQHIARKMHSVVGWRLSATVGYLRVMFHRFGFDQSNNTRGWIRYNGDSV